MFYISKSFATFLSKSSFADLWNFPNEKTQLFNYYSKQKVFTLKYIKEFKKFQHNISQNGKTTFAFIRFV